MNLAFLASHRGATCSTRWMRAAPAVSARVLEDEHRLLVETLRRIVSGELALSG
jgi:folate-dependent phosphoribosylglycinamide formyltransferase PurN